MPKRSREESDSSEEDLSTFFDQLEARDRAVKKKDEALTSAPEERHLAWWCYCENHPYLSFQPLKLGYNFFKLAWVQWRKEGEPELDDRQIHRRLQKQTFRGEPLTHWVRVDSWIGRQYLEMHFADFGVIPEIVDLLVSNDDLALTFGHAHFGLYSWKKKHSPFTLERLEERYLEKMEGRFQEYSQTSCLRDMRCGLEPEEFHPPFQYPNFITTRGKEFVTLMRTEMNYPEWDPKEYWRGVPESNKLDTLTKKYHWFEHQEGWAKHQLTGKTVNEPLEVSEE